MTDLDGYHLEKAIVGRKIVGIDRDKNELTLDDGTVIELLGTADCCAWFDIESITGEPTDNIITAVKEIEYPPGNDYGGYDGYTLVVLSESTELNRINVEGDIGNGYYVHAAEMEVRLP